MEKPGSKTWQCTASFTFLQPIAKKVYPGSANSEGAFIGCVTMAFSSAFGLPSYMYAQSCGVLLINEKAVLTFEYE